MDPGFEKGTNQNLPVVDFEMVNDFFATYSNFQDPAVKNVKTAKAAREDYSQNAIGYVQVRRESSICTVKAKVTPEHKIHQPPYNVIVKIDEEKASVLQCKCFDCSASEGGCKHGIALFLWLYHRHLEPSVTEVACYWKGSKLSKVGTSIKFTTMQDLSAKQIPPLPELDISLETIIEEGRRAGSVGTIFLPDEAMDSISKMCLHKLAVEFKQINPAGTAMEFKSLYVNRVTKKDCDAVEKLTREQRKSPDWFKVRYGRITASKLYEASRCTTYEGSLVESILGGAAPIQTPALLRGQKLEEEVLLEVEKTLKCKINKCGFYTLCSKSAFAMFGASPDGITANHVVEIKCPSKTTTVKNYLEDGGNIAKKPLAQLRLQMLLAGKASGYFCVAAPDFEKTRKVTVIETKQNYSELLDLLKNAKVFWENAIFPKL